MKLFINEGISNIIDNAIKQRGLPQKVVAEMVGVSESTISRVCNGKVRYLDIDIAKRLEEVLGISFVDLSLSSNDFDKLMKTIFKLQEENKLLKRLLVEKWSNE